MSKIKVSNIISFQSIESFEEATGLVYNELSDNELFNILSQWDNCENDCHEYNEDDLNTNFLGYIINENYLLARYERGLVIGLNYFTKNEV